MGGDSQFLSSFRASTIPIGIKSFNITDQGAALLVSALRARLDKQIWGSQPDLLEA